MPKYLEFMVALGHQVESYLYSLNMSSLELEIYGHTMSNGNFKLSVAYSVLPIIRMVRSST